MAETHRLVSQPAIIEPRLMLSPSALYSWKAGAYGKIASPETVLPSIRPKNLVNFNSLDSRSEGQGLNLWIFDLVFRCNESHWLNSGTPEKFKAC